MRNLLSRTSNHLMLAEAGSGARSYAHALVANALANEEAVLILDCGANHEHFCKLMGGTVLRMAVSRDGRQAPILSTFDAQNSMPLQVFDFDRAETRWTGPLPSPEPTFRRKPGLLVVDRLEKVHSRFPALEQLVKEHIGAKGRCCLIGETESALLGYRAFCGPAVLTRFAATLLQ